MPSTELTHCDNSLSHYNDVIMGTTASQITSLTIVYSTVYSDADQRKHQSSASLAFVRGIHRGSVNSPHKWQVTRKMFPIDDVMDWRENSWFSWYLQQWRHECHGVSTHRQMNRLSNSLLKKQNINVPHFCSFMMEIHRLPVVLPHKETIVRKPFHWRHHTYSLWWYPNPTGMSIVL